MTRVTPEMQQKNYHLMVANAIAAGWDLFGLQEYADRWDVHVAGIDPLIQIEVLGSVYRENEDAINSILAPDLWISHIADLGKDSHTVNIPAALIFQSGVEHDRIIRGVDAPFDEDFKDQPVNAAS